MRHKYSTNMKTYSEANTQGAQTRKKRMGEKAFKAHMKQLAIKRWGCKCGHWFTEHDGACCKDKCKCRVFRQFVSKK
jgi:hypothetical protein